MEVCLSFMITVGALRCQRLYSNYSYDEYDNALLFWSSVVCSTIFCDAINLILALPTQCIIVQPQVSQNSGLLHGVHVFTGNIFGLTVPITMKLCENRFIFI